MRNVETFRVFGKSAGLALLTGFGFGCLTVAGDNWASVVTSPLNVVTVAVFSAGPPVLVSALAAGWLASSMVTPSRAAWPISAWLRRGMSTGAVVGACVLVLWSVIIALGEQPPVKLVAVAAGVGALAGGLSGAVVAIYCHHVVRSRFAA